MGSPATVMTLLTWLWLRMARSVAIMQPIWTSLEAEAAPMPLFEQAGALPSTRSRLFVPQASAQLSVIRRCIVQA